MGRIQTLTISDFKSYGGEHKVMFKTFTCVIGPNGAGKSNLMDAISFVLGVRTNQLRGSQMKDLIHRTSDEAGDKPLRTAFVQLDYEDDGEIKEFRRTIKPDGSAYYSVNGERKTWKAYNECLSNIGVLTGTRNFLVFQGDVESIAQKNPMQLTSWFEQISGSGELRVEYDRLKGEHKKAEENLIDHFEKQRTLQKERKQMKAQKDEAEHYREVVESMASTKTEFYLFQLYHLQQDMKVSQSSLKQVIGAEKGTTVKLEEREKSYKSEQKNISSMNKKNNKTLKEIAKYKKILDEQEKRQDEDQERITHYQNQIDRKTKSLNKVLVDKNKQTEKCSELEKKIEELQGDQRSFQAEFEENASDDIKKVTEHHEEYRELQDEAKKKTISMQQALEKKKTAYRKAKNSFESTETNLEALRKRFDAEKRAVEELTKKVNQKDEDETQIAEELETAKENLKNFVDVNKETTNRIHEINKELENCTSRLTNARADQYESKREQRAKECLEKLKQNFPGVKGRLADLMKPNSKRYNMAITVSLGKSYEAIVVDTAQTSMKCVKFLKRQRLGAFTFLPLDSLKTRPIKEHLRTLHAKSKLAIDCIEYEDEYHRAMQYALGNTLIIDNMGLAKQICYGSLGRGERHKAVTLKGTLIAKNGNITGGSQGAGGFASKARLWDDKEVQVIRDTRDKLLAELKNLENELEGQNEADLRQAIDNKQHQLNLLLTGKVNIAKLLDRKTKEEKQVAKEIEKTDKVKEKQQTKMETAKEGLDAAEKDVNKIKDKIYEEFAKKLGVKSIAEYESKGLERVQEFEQKNQKLLTQINKIEQQLKLAQSKDFSRTIANLEKAVRTLEKDQEKAGGSSKKRKHEIKKLATKIAECEQLVASNQDDLKVAKVSTRKMRKEINQVKNELERITNEKIKRKEETQHITTLRQLIVDTARVENVRLPTVRKRKRGKNSGKSRKRRKLDDGEAENNGDETDEESPAVRFDFSSVRDSAESVEDFNAKKKQYTVKIAELEEDVHKLAPNMKAIEQYDDIKRKADKVVSEYKEARNMRDEKKHNYDAVQENRTQLFIDAFDHVKRNISKMYSDMTKSESFPNGGSATLTLESTTEPYLRGINYHAMPPMKRFRDMEQLSGGEKSVASLALLFSIHSFKPAPFFILDEVDAALDATNVDKVSRFIKQKCYESDPPLQCIVISLKDLFYEKAGALVGIYKDRKTESSGVLHVDLTRFENLGEN